MVLLWCTASLLKKYSGPVHTVFTLTEIFIALNSTVQVIVTLGDTKGCIGLAGLLVIVTEFGGGTEVKRKSIKIR